MKSGSFELTRASLASKTVPHSHIGGKQAGDSEAARGPDGDVTPHAHTGAGATWLAEQRVAGARRLLRFAEQLAAAGQLSPGDHAPLVSSASPAESTSPHVGAVQRVASALPASSCPHHSLARGLSGQPWVTFGKSRVRESRSLGSVGAKTEWLSYPTITDLSRSRQSVRTGP